MKNNISKAVRIDVDKLGIAGNRGIFERHFKRHSYTTK